MIRNRFAPVTLVAAVVFVAGAAWAQTPASTGAPAPTPETAAPSSRSATSAGDAPSAPPAAQAPAGTVVEIEITQFVSSKTAKIGDRFTLRLAAPIVASGQVVVPAGVPGVGEVIDANTPGFMGAPGKLVLAARYLDYGGRRIPLRTLRLGGDGKDNTTLTTVAMFAFGLPAGLIKGGNIEIPAGTYAHAKLVSDYPPAQAPAAPTVTPAAAAPAPSAPSAAPLTSQGIEQ